MQTFLSLIIGGSLGTLCRYGIGLMSQHWAVSQNFPAGTLLANVLGCLILGLFLGVTEARQITLPPSLRLMLVVGFLGALTTFSTFELDTFLLLKEGAALKAAANVLLSIGLGFAALWAAFTWSSWFFAPPKWN
ncbi:MAG: fluoride efflux transporter CrcB [Candidatus Melainabacteria bacterium]